MDLDIEPAAPRLFGRAEVELTVEVVGEVDEADLILLEVERGLSTPALKKMKASHHNLARCLASGMKDYQASLVSGYSQIRISLLRTDPGFKNLVEEYRKELQGEVTAVAADLAELMLGLSQDALEEIRERLHDKPEDFSNSQLLEIVTRTADRTGFGPKSTNVNVNVDLGGRLEAARRRMKSAGSSQSVPPALAGPRVNSHSGGDRGPTPDFDEADVIDLVSVEEPGT